MKHSSLKNHHKEIQLEGVAASPGIAIGNVFLLGGDVVKVEPRTIAKSEIVQEIKRFNDAVEKTKSDLAAIRAETRHTIGEESAQVFDAHQMMLEDEAVIEATELKIKDERKNADFAFLEVMEKFEFTFAGFKDEYMQARAVDLRDVKRRVIRNIQGNRRADLGSIERAAVVVAKDITPSDTVALNRQKVMGFATDLGSRTSHAAIMARSLEVPSVVGLKHIAMSVKTGDRIIVDGNKGTVVVNPLPKTIKKYQRLKVKHIDFESKLKANRHLPARTKDGKDIELSANLEFPDELEAVSSYGAKGVGLYRTEYLYLSKPQLPTEDEQYEEYLRVVEGVYPNSVIIRTFDLGGDKVPDCMDIPPEENPFLGLRAVRLCLERQECFETQLRAILRASMKGNVKILFPMISSLTELRQCKVILEKVKAELSEQNIHFDKDVEIGVMIEVPSASVIADMLAAECDFLTIGTNDLTQYVLAVDRGNEHIAHLYRNMNPAVIRMIHDTITRGHSQGVWVGMCGEMAGDPLATMLLLGLGLDEFSMSPVALPEIKEIIRRVEFSESEHLAAKAMQLRTTEEVEDYILNIMKVKFKDLPLW